MKRSIIPLLIAGLACTTGAAEPSSRVTAVTVYTDRALVEREAAITLPDGETTIVLKDLPANLWDQSLQVSGTGPAGTSVIDVQSRNLFLESEPSPEIRTLKQKLVALRQDKRVLEDERAALDYDRSVLERISQAATTVPEEGDAPRPSFDDWRELMKFNAQENRRLQDAMRENATNDQTLRDKIAAAERQLQEARGRIPGRRAVKQITVRLQSASAGQGQLNISYTVPGANWTPSYRARFNSTTREIALEYQAQVINHTGEAWNNVALTLSTAQPAAGGSAPEPMPWVVEERRRAEARNRRTMEMANSIQLSEFESDEVKFAGYAGQPATFSAPMNVAEATVKTNLTSAIFVIADPSTIPADGTATNVTVTTMSLDAGLRYATAPKYQTAAFLTAKVENNSDYPLLGGSLAAFVDGAFVADSHLETTLLGEEFELALGVDEAVEIERNLINRFVEKTGFINSGTRVTYEIAIKVTNRKSVPVSIELAEPLPISRHEKIIVKLVDPTERQIGTEEDPQPFTRDEQGILTWTGSIAAGAAKDLTLKFSIEHPHDLNVDGIE